MADPLPRLSIVTPSFNQGSFIEATIRSVLEQGYPDLEYLVIDGGSTDNTLEILRRYEDRLQWISEPDRGQSDAINKGFRRATGEVVAYLNSDDLYEPGALLAVGQFFAEHPEAMWVTGRCRIIDHQARECRRLITWYKNFWLRTGSRGVLAVLNYVSQPATFWRRRVIAEIGELDEALHFTMDYDYWLRLSSRWPVHVIDRFLASFHIHPGSKGGTSAARQFSEGFHTARRYVRSPLLLALHRVHDALTLRSYRYLAGRS